MWVTRAIHYSNRFDWCIFESPLDPALLWCRRAAVSRSARPLGLLNSRVGICCWQSATDAAAACAGEMRSIDATARSATGSCRVSGHPSPCPYTSVRPRGTTADRRLSDVDHVVAPRWFMMRCLVATALSARHCSPIAPSARPPGDPHHAVCRRHDRSSAYGNNVERDRDETIRNFAAEVPLYSDRGL